MLFVDDPYQILKHISHSGTTTFKNRQRKLVEHSFSKQGDEISIAQNALLGVIDYHRRSLLDVVMEGIHITPEWVSGLGDVGMNVRAIFVGFTSTSHVDSIFEHARNNPHDAINDWITRLEGGEDEARRRLNQQTVKNTELKHHAEELGYPFIDVSAVDFEEYLSLAIQALLNDMTNS